MITNENLNKIYKIVLTIILIISTFLIGLLFFYKPNYYKNKINIKNENRYQRVTANTVRIEGKDLYETCTSISQIVYPSTFRGDRPNAVILVRSDKVQDAMLAARVSHDPINAPILFTKKNSIPESTLKEIERLNPEGLFVDGNAKIILIGDIGEEIKNTLNKKNLKYRHIKGKDVYDLSLNIDNYLAAFQGDHKDVVIIAPIEKPEYSLAQASWNAHNGDGFFFVEKNKVPEPVKKALKARYGGAYIYILGDKIHISNKVKKELAKYGHVERIPGGENIYNQAVSFATYKDVGKNFSWWFHKKSRDFGWGITQPGHNFIFVNPDNWQVAVASSLLSHKGKHAPILLVYKNSIPENLKDYLYTIKPSYISSQEISNNHGWIIGNSDYISDINQVKIDSLLEGERSNR
ncbi:cell wall-binding repeat-containing protein [Clostridium sporogenes]|uniref:Cell surface protein n=2 Tax=Clostridium TaxID=1485 RepID=A0A0D1BUA1_CLOBO|nr:MULTISPECIES: cell wall-binding repeat-containing protein [Clostridium]MBE6076470.1 cell wall-binding repeat-containing protein [Clostridium lundense]MDU2833348.1 cell wall-binding repeat-containing protein [Clostridium botulinum]KIS23362.1 cell surface protein [Clostridium botulinum B2 450]MCW6094927.1 cell wall-binding repeat-containing protein [Clostridium sporogenes]MCW7998400.1 cell wall-binding repeat 2 family protein [Clostridium sp. cpc1]